MKKLLTVLCCLFFGIVSLPAGAQTAIEPVVTTSTGATETLKLKVKGVGCDNDLRTLAQRVKALTGVARCNPLKRGAVSTFEVVHDPAVATAAAIQSAIENTAGCTAPDSRPYKVKW